MTKTMFTLLALGALLVGCEEGGDAAATGDKVGIAACDEYITKMEACIEKMPAESKEPQKQGLKAVREGWKAAASGATKDTVATACKTALDTFASNPLCK